jgi:oxygen-independent coproporphyrinogen-3 oxidase
MQVGNKIESDARWLNPRSAYVHIPFCAHHCCYCDFAIAVGQDDQIGQYLDALAAEMKATLGTPQRVDTLFIGGGTPTLLNAEQLQRLMALLHRWLSFDSDHEFAIEANPSTITPDKIAVLADHGVNRISLGAQSFQPERLRFLERDHTVEDIVRAVEYARPRIRSISLDLIFGTPGQMVDSWGEDLRQALILKPDHLSTYGLTYEKGTPLWKQRRAGAFRPLDEDGERALYEESMNVLEAAGFEHYEISNFARPGRRCRHNEVYWANWAHWGLGMGAAGYVNGRRHLNSRDLSTYMKRALAGESPEFQVEILDSRERARETMAIQLRRSDGIRRDEFCAQTGFGLDGLAGRAIARHVEMGFLADHGDSVRLTREGKFVADAVIEALLV